MTYLCVYFYNDNNNFYLVQLKHQISQVEKMREKQGEKKRKRKSTRNVK